MSRNNQSPPQRKLAANPSGIISSRDAGEGNEQQEVLGEYPFQEEGLPNSFSSLSGKDLGVVFESFCVVGNVVVTSANCGLVGAAVCEAPSSASSYCCLLPTSSNKKRSATQQSRLTVTATTMPTNADYEDVDSNKPFTMLSQDELSHIISFVGSGCFLYFAGTCKRFRKTYEDYLVREHRRLGNDPKPIYFHTSLFNMASSRSCTTLWWKHTGGVRAALTKNKFSVDDVGTYAARGGNLLILHWASSASIGYRLNWFTCALAAAGGHLQVLKWARRKGARWDSHTCQHAAFNGHFELLQWARKGKCPWNASVCTAAAKTGRLTILQWARVNGCPWDASCCAAAALRGDLIMLQWLHGNDCPNDTDVCENAAGNGHLGVLQWAYRYEYPWSNSVSDIAAECGQVNILQWIVEHDLSWDEGSACNKAIKGGHPHVLEWARGKGWRLDHSHASYAAGAGRLNVLKWLHDNECPWTSSTCARAAENGHWTILKWLHASGCPWDEDTCSHAAKCGRLDILKWARAKKCPWDAFTTKYAIETGNMLVYEWAKENGCPVNRSPHETRDDLFNTFTFSNYQGAERSSQANVRARFIVLPER